MAGGGEKWSTGKTEKFLVVIVESEVVESLHHGGGGSP